MATQRRCTHFLLQQSHQTLAESRASAKAPSPTPSASSRSLTTTVCTPNSYVPIQHGLSVLVSTEVPLVPIYQACGSCGSKTHLLMECPVLHYSDANSDYQTEWESSTVGMAWAAAGCTEWQLSLILPGYEDRVQYYPKGSVRLTTNVVTSVV